MGSASSSFDARETLWGLDEYDVANQGLISHHFDVRGSQVEKSSGPFRYVWPAELDLMAQLAGMTQRERWAGWRKEPFAGHDRRTTAPPVRKQPGRGVQ